MVVYHTVPTRVTVWAVVLQFLHDRPVTLSGLIFLHMIPLRCPQGHQAMIPLHAYNFLYPESKAMTALGFQHGNSEQVMYLGTAAAAFLLRSSLKVLQLDISHLHLQNLNPYTQNPESQHHDYHDYYNINLSMIAIMATEFLSTIPGCR